MSPTLPQPAPSQAQTLEAGKGLARLAQAEQPLDRGSVLSRLGAGLQLRQCGSSLGPFQYRLARTRRQPNSSLPRAGNVLSTDSTMRANEDTLHVFMLTYTYIARKWGDVTGGRLTGLSSALPFPLHL